MICIAAFIVLALLSLSLPVLRLFNKKLADSIWKNLKAAWGCVGRRVTLRPCDTSFKQDIENAILRKVLRKNPALVRPAKIAIEVVAALIIIVTIWSLLVVVKSGLSLYVYGTCDVRRPSACSISSVEACSIDSVSSSGAVVDWFSDWGAIFTALPARMTTWNASELVPSGAASYGDASSELPVAVDIFDPGCVVCRQSYANQKSTGFMDQYQVYLIPYAIPSEDGYRFAQSRLISRYIEAIRAQHNSINEWTIIERLFTDSDPETRYDYQDAFNLNYSEDEAEAVLLSWLAEAGLTEAEQDAVKTRAHSAEIDDKLEQNRRLVEDTVRTKYIPTMIYDGKRHEGLFTE